MQYSIYINQPKAIEWGLNLQQAALFSFCYELPSWAQEKLINGKAYYWISKSYITQRVPILTDKPDTIKRLLKILSDFGLIDRQVVDKVKLYVRVTKKGKEWNEHNDGAMQVGKKIPGGGEKNPRGGGEKNPPYTNTINTNTKINNVSNETLDKFWSDVREAWKISNSPPGNKAAFFKSIKNIDLTDEILRHKIINQAVRQSEAVKKLNDSSKPDLNLPNASTWFNQRRWEQDVTDYYSLDKQKPSAGHAPPGSARPPQRRRRAFGED